MAQRATPLGIYIHVPFCAARCGYCDFNTYVAGGPEEPRGYLEAAQREIALARAQLGERVVSTVFFGGGTPTLLGAEPLVGLLDAVAAAFALADGVEVTAEANPETVTPELLAGLRRGGFTRLSLGMQSAAAHVLATLERAHTPGRAVDAARQAREAGFEHVSLDLIYGTPGESDEDWAASLDAALSCGVDHVSAYALTLEPGTALWRAVARGALPMPDDAAQARRYAYADERLSAEGFHWYELSSWARSEAARCSHNIGYWRSYDWWGIGPGAHSHVAGRRFWNVRHPARYGALLAAGGSPEEGSELLTEAQRGLEAVMLGLRERGGLPLAQLGGAGGLALERELARGRVVVVDGRVELTRRGRLFADAVIRELTA